MPRGKELPSIYESRLLIVNIDRTINSLWDLIRMIESAGDGLCYQINRHNDVPLGPFPPVASSFSPQGAVFVFIQNETLNGGRKMPPKDQRRHLEIVSCFPLPTVAVVTHFVVIMTC